MLKSKILFQKFEQGSLMRIRIPLLFLLAAAVVAARKTIFIRLKFLEEHFSIGETPQLGDPRH